MLWFEQTSVVARDAEINTRLLRRHPSTAVKAPRQKSCHDKGRGFGVNPHLIHQTVTQYLPGRESWCLVDGRNGSIVA
jgi:hypothetical protein